jgi:Protein of unknown function (DUF3179)
MDGMKHAGCCAALAAALLATAPSTAQTSRAGTNQAAPPKAAAAAAMLPLDDFLFLLDVPGSRARAALARIDAQWQDGYAAMLLESLGFMPDSFVQRDVIALLQRKSGRPGADEQALWEWIWAMEPVPHPQYAEFKARIYEVIDPRFREYFDRQPKALIRLDEIRWGGVRRDGIPPLKNPSMIAAAEATWLADGDIVFGVAIDGDVRAYPKRILAWHEMVKDRIAGRELAGVYCTLCGAMILYDTTVGGVQHELGTSGFLYRSNKLMYDQATKSLWSTFDGAPVVGALAGKGIALPTLYVVTTTWKEWKKRHPQTRVLSLDTGHARDYREGAAYAGYFATDRLMFGVPRLDARLPNKAEVLALRFADAPGEPLAIAADYLFNHRVFHERIGKHDFVVLTDAGGANRVYAAGGRRFAGWDGEQSARDSDGGVWRVEEDRLRGPAGQTLPRLPAHRAFWFGWYAAYPQTRLVK